MKVTKLVISTLTVLAVTTTGAATLSSTATTAFAKKAATAKVVKTTNFKSKHKVHVRGGAMYTSTKLTKKNHNMNNYLYTKFYATKQVTIRQKNGKNATYSYLISKNGKVKGYVKSSNVWNMWGYGKYSVTAYRKGALKALNLERKNAGLKPLKETAKLDKVAQKNSDRMLKDGKKFKANVKGVSHAGWVFDSYVAPKSNAIIQYEDGASWGKGTIDELMSHTNLVANKGAKAKPYLLSKKHTMVGFGATQHGEAVYEFIVVSHK
ncbi:CAP domain-containing protein [Lactiplantibacillus fabifermentans]|uniref:SCP domain-containing protein n=2 Tax=Lactiplantibacillus fabifermentans TaxID=483011 RepID=A0A0R2NKQ8_9LACO|nr:CAP domain-containing protein [Lactiplantibacillus fabifermentans]ETY72852.1 hypothetical protein LFAB_15510 [Lactiplantibacillus fabifermentans T30PCM01]KRO26358.1 hypothetical protein DY78_GL001052 [Lactiplantibacillus fabifermentans DSM 21115]